jgi:isocitrate dehydrogenase
MRVSDGCKAELVVTDKDGNETRQLIHEFKGSDGIFRDFITLTNQ